MENSVDMQYERLLGEGSYGKVFLVKQHDGQKFAVKEIELTKCDDSGRDQAHGEANLLSRLKHGHILMYVESVICDDCLYIVTEFCEGGDLEDYLQLLLKSSMSVPESLISEWILQLGEALKYLHDQKILHRDMKTKNIFLKDDLTVKLGDLGIAKVLDLNQSKADTFIGTPSYMSPELFTGKSYNHKTDIWGLGCCVYEMMTMKRAFQGRALWTLIKEIKNGRTLETPDTYSLEIRTLVQEMMAQKPEDRPSAKDIVQNDLLLYHRESANHDHETLLKPGQAPEKKKKSGSGSGSLRQVLKQMNQSEEEKFRNTINTVREKINTLRMNENGTNKSVGGESDSGTMIEYDTFVYKGSDSEEETELEAQGTVLNSSLLKQYTEQLETFVFTGFDDNDSDYFTGGSLGNMDNKGNRKEKKKEKAKSGCDGHDKKVADDRNKESDDDDDVDNTSSTLLRQYSQTLIADDDGSDIDDNATIVRSPIKVKSDAAEINQAKSNSSSEKPSIEIEGVRLKRDVKSGNERSSKSDCKVQDAKSGEGQRSKGDIARSSISDSKVQGQGSKSVDKIDGGKLKSDATKGQPQKPVTKVNTEALRSRPGDKGEGSNVGHLESDDDDDLFDETIKPNSVSKYQYKGLKDTLALRPDKKWKRPHSDPSEWFSPTRANDTPSSSSLSEEGDDEVTQNKPRKSGKTVTYSLASTGDFNRPRQFEDPRLMQTADISTLTSKSRPSKMPVCDRIEQSAKSKAVSDRQKSPKKAPNPPGGAAKGQVASSENRHIPGASSNAFSENDKALSPDFDGELDVQGVMSHLRDNISPYASVDSQSHTIEPRKPSSAVSQSMDASPTKGKKKESFLKKQIEAKKKSTNSDGTSASDVQLFTRAQAVKFSKSDDDSSTT